MDNIYDLLKLLKEYKIKIPEIQRDYAFGRREEESKGKNFVKDIYDCLINKDKILDLGFIYGIRNDKKIVTIILCKALCLEVHF